VKIKGKRTRVARFPAASREASWVCAAEKPLYPALCKKGNTFVKITGFGVTFSVWRGLGAAVGDGSY